MRDMLQTMVGLRIKELRAESGLSQERFAPQDRHGPHLPCIHRGRSAQRHLAKPGQDSQRLRHDARRVLRRHPSHQPNQRVNLSFPFFQRVLIIPICCVYTTTRIAIGAYLPCSMQRMHLWAKSPRIGTRQFDNSFTFLCGGRGALPAGESQASRHHERPARDALSLGYEIWQDPYGNMNVDAFVRSGVGCGGRHSVVSRVGVC